MRCPPIDILVGFVYIEGAGVAPPPLCLLPVQQFEDCRCNQTGDCARQDCVRQDLQPVGLRRRLMPSAFFLAHLNHPFPLELSIL